MLNQEEQFTAPGKYEIDYAMKYIELKLKENSTKLYVPRKIELKSQYIPTQKYNLVRKKFVQIDSYL